jgi:acetyl-CoA carboxylase carboxyl transferase subunit alpha
LAAAAALKGCLLRNLKELLALSAQERKEKRYHKFRQIGVFLEA